MISRLFGITCFAASAFVCATAHAQQPAPDNPPAPPAAPTASALPPVPAGMPPIPPPTCVKPEYPQKFADQRRFDRFNKESKAYTDCVTKYTDDMKALSDAAIARGQALINEYNALTADYNSRKPANAK
jgi:hypothetical protein